jgi:hypothetical protein
MQAARINKIQKKPSKQSSVPTLPSINSPLKIPTRNKIGTALLVLLGTENLNMRKKGASNTAR